MGITFNAYIGMSVYRHLIILLAAPGRPSHDALLIRWRSIQQHGFRPFDRWPPSQTGAQASVGTIGTKYWDCLMGAVLGSSTTAPILAWVVSVSMRRLCRCASTC
jgi:hypothetical protein